MTNIIRLVSILSCTRNWITYNFHQEYYNFNSWYFVGFIFGIIFYFHSGYKLSYLNISIFLIINFSLLALFKKSLFSRFITITVIFFILGILVSKYRSDSLRVTTIKKPIISQISGHIESIKPTDSGVQLILDITKLFDSSIAISKAKVNIPVKHYHKVMLGDEILLKARLFPPKASIIPGGYDFGFHAYFAQIGANGYAMSPLLILKNSDMSPMQLIIYKIRMFIYVRLVEKLGDLEGNFAAAIFLGETAGIDKNVMSNMRLAGISHILCVSGLHLSLVAMIFFVVVRCLLNCSNYIAYKFNVKIIAAICSIVGSYCYLELSGKQIAASRAFIMTAISIMAIILSRRAYPLRSIGLAALAILILNPEYIFKPSFQLSFVAVLSLIAGYQFYLKNSWILGISKGLGASIKLYLISNIYSSFLASVLTAPIVISHFYIFSTYCIPMNLIAVPIMSFAIMPLTIISLVMMPLGLDALFLKVLGFFIKITIYLANYSNTLPGSVWYFGSITPLSLIIFMLGFFWLSIWQTRLRLVGVVIIIFAAVLMSISPKPDVIFDVNSNIVGVKNNDNKLVIYTKSNMSRFNNQYWANWFGQKDAQVIPTTIDRITTNSGKTIAINYSDRFCKPADIQINIYNAHCVGKESEFKMQKFSDISVITIYCDQKICSIKNNTNYNPNTN